MTNNKGFTLIELMAVVAIVAILMGIAIGSFSRSADSTTLTDGIVGAHTIAAAYDSYYYEHGKYPTSLKSLPISLTGGVISTDNIATDRFTYTIVNDNSAHPWYVKGQRKNGNYYVVTYLETNKPQYVDRCVGSSTDGEDFCASMGYSCTKDNLTGLKCYAN